MRLLIRGMGVGILIATLIFSIAYMVRDEEISDEEVIRRARQLGMVESSQSIIKNKEEDNVSEGNVSENDENDDSDMTDVTVSNGAVSPASTDAVDTVVNSDSNIVTVEIPKGMDGIRISELLQEKGVIKDAIDFNNYLSDRQIQRLIMYGTYQLEKNSSYEEIVGIIIKKKLD